jgi:glycosyltransferase involved in cell wall biosynthesis
MTAPLLLDLSHTCHTRARTGIQRVARALWRELGAGALAVTWDPFARRWRPLAGWERANLGATEPGARRGARWPLRARWASRLSRWGRPLPPPPAGAALLVPEIFPAAVGAALPALFGAAAGPRIALFHDAIALQYPEHAPAATVARFPAYLGELLQFDGVAAVSEDSRRVLVDYWRWLGASSPPPVLALPLALDPPGEVRAQAAPPGEVPMVLCVGTIEGRKNHLALLEAAERLWQSGRSFELRLIGLAQPETGAPALRRIGQLQRAGRPLRYDGPAGEAALEAAYAQASFTVYPSLQEGFGLPVGESLLRGKPCICSARGALGEIARGGGCLALEAVDVPSLEAACGRLLTDPAERGRLAAAAAQRRFPPWSEYAARLRAWMLTLPRRPAAGPI